MHDSINTDARFINSESSISPFLAKSGTPRTGADQLPGYYCEQQKMWVVDTEQGPQPIIDGQVLSQLLTKTRVREEADDDSCHVLELMTKTCQKMERDDETQSMACSALLQLVTKTDSVREVDDNYSASQLLELATKTKVQQEADDDAFQCLGFHC